MSDWLSRTPIWLLGIGLFLITVAAAYAGSRVSRWFAKNPARWGRLTESQEGYIITTVYTLLGLLVGFTSRCRRSLPEPARARRSGCNRHRAIVPARAAA